MRTASTSSPRCRKTPRASDAASPPRQRVGGEFVISFTQPAGVSGITYGAEWSATLTGTWTPIADTGNGGQHTFSVPISSNTRMFVRLVVASP